jgi:hypothetical protein
MSKFATQISLEQHLYVGNHINGRINIDFKEKKNKTNEDLISNIDIQFYGVCFTDLKWMKPYPNKKCKKYNL